MDSERIWRIVDNHRMGVPPRKQTGSSPSLSDRLHDLYVDTLKSVTENKNADKRFRSTVNLLGRLERAHVRPSLIVNLYEDEKGYSLMLCPREGGETDEIFLPYEDNEIFSYLDNQEVPPVLMEVLEQTKYCHMYNGRVVCEVRDYRCHSVLAGYDRHLLLLRPTSETILATVDELAHQANCSHEEKLQLEARLLLATQPPLCLETTTEVLCVTNRLHYNQRKYHSPAVRRYLRRRCHAARALMQLALEEEAPEQLRVNDLISSEKPRGRNLSNLWKRPRLSLDTSQIDFSAVAREVTKLAKPVPREEALLESAEPCPPTQPTPPSHPPQPTPPSPPPQRPPPTQTPSIADELLQGKSESSRRTPVIQQPVEVHTPPQRATPPPVVPPPQPLPPQPPVVTPQLPYTPQLPRPVLVPRHPVQVVPSVIPTPVGLRGVARAQSPLTPPQLRALSQKRESVLAGIVSTTHTTPLGATPPRQVASPNPPKLKPHPQQFSPLTKTGGPVGMPKLHRLTPESSPAHRPLPLPRSASPAKPVISTTSTNSGPAMPQLHRIPAPVSGAPPVTMPTAVLGAPILTTIPKTPPVAMPTAVPRAPPVTMPTAVPRVPRLAMVPKPGVAIVTPQPQSSLSYSTHLLAPSVTPAHTPPPHGTDAVRLPTGPVMVPPRSGVADTRMPPSLSSLGTAAHSRSPVKHARSRSGKLISGTKVKSRTKK